MSQSNCSVIPAEAGGESILFIFSSQAKTLDAGLRRHDDTR